MEGTQNEQTSTPNPVDETIEIMNDKVEREFNELITALNRNPPSREDQPKDIVDRISYLMQKTEVKVFRLNKIIYLRSP